MRLREAQTILAKLRFIRIYGRTEFSEIFGPEETARLISMSKDNIKEAEETYHQVITDEVGNEVSLGDKVYFVRSCPSTHTPLIPLNKVGSRGEIWDYLPGCYKGGPAWQIEHVIYGYTDAHYIFKNEQDYRSFVKNKINEL